MICFAESPPIVAAILQQPAHRSNVEAISVGFDKFVGPTDLPGTRFRTHRHSSAPATPLVSRVKKKLGSPHPPFTLIKTIDTGPITNHVSFAETSRGLFAYVTAGSLNQVKVFRTDTFEQVAKIAVGKLPRGIWPSRDETRIYVGTENDDSLVAIDTATNKVSNAVPLGGGNLGLRPLGLAAGVTRLSLGFPKVPADAENNEVSPTSVSLSDQGLTQILEASVSGLCPGTRYVLALSENLDGSGARQPLSAFRTNPAGSAFVNATGPIQQIIKQDELAPRHYLVIPSGTPEQVGGVVQIHTSSENRGAPRPRTVLVCFQV